MKTMRTTVACMLLLTSAHRLSAQSLARFSFDSVAAIDLFQGENTVDRPNIVIDVTGVLRLSDGWVLYIRPWFRQPRTSEWDKEIYQAAIQYRAQRNRVDPRRRRLHRVADRPRHGRHAAGRQPDDRSASELRDADAGVRSDRTARAPDRLNLSTRRTSHGLDGAVGRPRRRRLVGADALVRHQRRRQSSSDPGVRRGRRFHTDARGCGSACRLRTACTPRARN